MSENPEDHFNAQSLADQRTREARIAKSPFNASCSNREQLERLVEVINSKFEYCRLSYKFRFCGHPTGEPLVVGVRYNCDYGYSATVADLLKEGCTLSYEHHFLVKSYQEFADRCIREFYKIIDKSRQTLENQSHLNLSTDAQSQIPFTVGIGNSDNKLTQQEWSEFFKGFKSACENLATNIFFSGCSNPDAPWQNASITGEISNERIHLLKQGLIELRTRFRQDSVALTFGRTELL